MTYNTIAYLIYLPICISLAILVGNRLHAHGIPLLEKILGDTKQARSMNQLLLMGFYLLVIGYIIIYMPIETEILNLEHLIEKLSYKLGLLLLGLGGLHYLNLLALYRIGRKAGTKQVSI